MTDNNLRTAFLLAAVCGCGTDAAEPDHVLPVEAEAAQTRDATPQPEATTELGEPATLDDANARLLPALRSALPEEGARIAEAVRLLQHALLSGDPVKIADELRRARSSVNVMIDRPEFASQRPDLEALDLTLKAVDASELVRRETPGRPTEN